MTTPVAGHPSITALAQSLGLRTSTAWKRISSLRCQGIAITPEAVASWTPPPRKKREPGPVKRALMRGACTALAKQAGCTPGAMRERLRRGQTIEEAIAPRVREDELPCIPSRLIAAAEKARPGARSGKPCAALRKHLAAGLTLAQALDAETTAAWARIEARRAA
jgi:hypothetical protein